MIQVIFPVLLLCVFSICAIMVVSMGADVYSGTVRKAGSNYTARTSVSYIAEKIHQNDAAGAVSVVKKNGRDMLALRQNGYSTYIYVYDGSLRELTAESGSGADLSEGTEIMQLSRMELSKKGSLIDVKCTDSSGRTRRALVNVHTSAGGKGASNGS
jgi:hypothetical protein